MTMVIAPIHKKLVLRCSPERAFALFTDELGSWWPLETHSVFGKDAVSVVFEQKEGGRIYETSSDGDENVWSIVSVWEPPSRIVFSWSPGRDKSVQTEIEVRFGSDEQGTRFELIHRGWECFGADSERYRNDYDGGWDGVLENLGAAAA